MDQPPQLTFELEKYFGHADDVPPLSFGYIYNLWNGDQHGIFPPILFTSNFARAFDAYTGEPMFNVTNMSYQDIQHSCRSNR